MEDDGVNGYVYYSNFFGEPWCSRLIWLNKMKDLKSQMDKDLFCAQGLCFVICKGKIVSISKKETGKTIRIS